MNNDEYMAKNKYNVELEERLVSEVKKLIEKRLNQGGIDLLYDSLGDVSCCNHLVDMWSKLSEDECQKLLRYDSSIIERVYENYNEASIIMDPELQDLDEYINSQTFKLCIGSILYDVSENDMRSKAQQKLEDKLSAEFRNITEEIQKSGEIEEHFLHVGYLRMIANDMAAYVTKEQAEKLLEKDNVLQSVYGDWISQSGYMELDGYFCGEDFMNYIDSFIAQPQSKKQSLSDKLTAAEGRVGAQEKSQGKTYRQER